MGIARTIIKLGIAKKVYDEVRRPENQRRIKDAVASFQERRNARQRGHQHRGPGSGA